MDTEDRKLELLEEKEQLLSLKRKEVTSVSLEQFVDSYLSELSTVKRPAFHKVIMGKLESLAESRLLFIAPRGFAKSTICSRFFPLWLAAHQKKKDIFLVSATISLAKENLRIIRNEIENNEKLIKDFGELKSDKWTEEQLVLSNGTIIRAKGRGFQIRGFRPDIIICDDLEDEEVIYSQEQRDKMENWFFRTLLPTLKPDQHLVYIGTKLHRLALIAKLQAKSEFEASSYQALEDGKSIWEEMWPTTKLFSLREEMGEYAFQAEYQNNPLSLTEQPVKPHHLEGITCPGAFTVTCMAIDPAISEKEAADYRAITIFGMTEDGKFRELVTERGRWELTEQISKIVDMYERHKPTRVLLEEVGFQKVLRPLIKKEADERGIYIPLDTAEIGMGPGKRPKDKMTRLMQIVHLFEQRVVEVNTPVLKQELLDFPFGENDDTVDACVYSLYWLKEYREGKWMVKKEEDDIGKAVGARESFYVAEIRPGVFYAKIGVPPPNFAVKPKLFNYDKH